MGFEGFAGDSFSIKARVACTSLLSDSASLFALSTLGFVELLDEATDMTSSSSPELAEKA